MAYYWHAEYNDSSTSQNILLLLNRIKVNLKILIPVTDCCIWLLFPGAERHADMATTVNDIYFTNTKRVR
jgi:hypothetical protein